jgi:hypothetical protein
MMHLMNCYSLLLLTASTAFADFTGQVVSVLDGDTIEVLHNNHPERIRLSGIDCPEKGQSYGNNASTPLGPHGSPIGNQDQTCVLWAGGGACWYTSAT